VSDQAVAAAADALIARLCSESGFTTELISRERLLGHVRSRMGELRAKDIVEVFARIANDPSEYARVEGVFAPAETWLFRYRESFEFIRAFAAARGGRPLRVLIAGAGGWCEPVSVAVAIASAGSSAAMVVFDRNPAVFAGPQRFEGMHVRGGIPDWAERFLPSDGDARVADPQIGSAMLLHVGDVARIGGRLVADSVRFDLVLFRNVAIYMSEAPRAAAFRTLAALLVKDGALMVGHAEVRAACDATGFVPSTSAGAFAVVAPNAQSQPLPSAADLARLAAAAEQPQRAAQSQGFQAHGLQPHGLQAHGLPQQNIQPHASSPQPEPRFPAPLTPVDAARVALRKSPTDIALHLGLARELEAAGQLGPAMDAVVRAIYLDRSCEEALVLAARLADEQGHPADAERFRMRALRAHLDRTRDDENA